MPEAPDSTAPNRPSKTSEDLVPSPGNEPLEYDEAPPLWTDADAGSGPEEPNASSEGGPHRPGRAGSHATQRTSGTTGEADPLALIEEVFPGRIMEFTAAPVAANQNASEPAEGDVADPDAFPDEPEEDDE